MPGKISLLDLTPDTRLVEWRLVYYPRTPHFFWAGWLKQGFRHVELWRAQSYGEAPDQVAWLILKPSFEILESYIDYDSTPPEKRTQGVTVQKVQVLSKFGTVRQWFHIGPFSCVEVAKYALGINSFWMRTPRQLYQYLKKRKGVLGVE